MDQNQGKLGFFDCAMILIGGMMGSAIFSLSGVTIVSAGPASILSWVLGGIIYFCYGLLNAELSMIYPKSGGVFMFPAKTLGKTPEQGRFWGWLATWAYLFGCVCGIAFSAAYVGIYLGVAFPALARMQVPLALAAVLVSGVLNIFKISVTGKANTIITILLSATLLVFIGVSLGGGQWNSALLSPFFTQGTQGAMGFVSAVPISMVAYGSIVAAAFMVGEIKDPNKNIPRAMVIAMGVVITVYALVMVATLGMVSSGFLQEHPEMTYIPLYAAAFTKLSHLPWLPAMLSVAAVMALFTTMLILTALGSRAIQAAANSGVLPSVLGKNSKKNNVPVYATGLLMIALAAMSFFPDMTLSIINMGAMCNVIVVCIICVTVIAARRKHPTVTTFRAPGGSALPIVMLVVLVACYVPGILSGGWQLWAFTGGYLLIGLFIFLGGAQQRKSAREAE